MSGETTISVLDGDGNVIVAPMPFGEFQQRVKQVTVEAQLERQVTIKKLAGKSKEGPMAERGNREAFTPEEMGSEAAQTVAAGQLRAFIERVERLEEDKKAIADDIKEVFAEMKGTGFDTKAVRTLIRLRKKDQAERQEEEAILDLYKAALGMV
jgi:uncharacterized protein (UPF0335 family)